MFRSRHAVARICILFLLVQIAFAAAKPKDKKPAHVSTGLASRIEKILSQPDAARAFWGIEVVDVASGETLYTQNADKLFTPASNTKLFTTSAVLALIGPDYKFRTTIETTGSLDKYGRLSGDVAVVGRGDPNLTGGTLAYNLRSERNSPRARVLEQLADQLVQRGVKFIDGDVVGDDSYFAFERYGEGWSQEDMRYEWGAPVSALTINDNLILVSVMPGDHSGDKAFINVTPFPDYYHFDNRIMTTPAGTGPRSVTIGREPGSNTLTLWGNIPVDDPGFHESLAIEDPADFTAQLFRTMLEQRGIVVYGRTHAKHLELASLSTFSVTATASAGGGDIPRTTRPTVSGLVLGEFQSQTLVSDLRVINKMSQNLHAELMLRLLGREKGAAGTIEAGSEVVRGFLSQADIRSDEYAFYDGSGLSRQNLVTPHAIVKLLLYDSRQPWAAQFDDMLPVAGVDGSLTERFRGTPAQGRVHGKTGSLKNVNALSGYATTLRGQRIAFSIMVNNHNLTSRVALQTIDQIANALVEEAK
ncbi:MAG: D-alanyl-D-alanine carboxypeptidase/D-alanyl-D-alanine-endopeptidase [Terriglobales bacterium]|jgi:D-alanyl-D-alanine carboxypeptidase/D-alanyl-D-alanine-endopeptidase (penicillin-binding protein 4)